jgi:hypothetical protein
MSATAISIAGIPIPDSAVAREATEFVKDIATPLLFDHSRRVFLWASLHGEKLGLRYDPVERPRLARRGEDGHAPASRDVVLPFVGIGVPVQLADRARVDLDERRRDRRGGGEARGVGDPHAPGSRPRRPYQLPLRSSMRRRISAS